MINPSERPHLQVPPHSGEPRTAGLPATAEQMLEVRRVVHQPDLMVIGVVGEIDEMSVKLLNHALWQDLPAATVLDLSQVTFLGVAGLRAIACAAERARAEHRRLGLVVTTHLIARVLRMCGMEDLLPTFTTLSDAVRELSGPTVPARR
ncbi:STAS domain-containing protein [Amycolatopsis sp. NPDC051128]|uniref:STAS domain-containing protein n=1 Tax=Amycolatopsis sp. NPDC051128 TaxID=3155412 RepID=UPI00342B2FED